MNKGQYIPSLLDSPSQICDVYIAILYVSKKAKVTAENSG
jgi:hypothetical protein